MNIESASHSNAESDSLVFLRDLSTDEKGNPSADGGNPVSSANEVFVPIEPQSLQGAGLNKLDIESLILKYLNSHGNQNGRQIARHIKLPFGIVREVLDSLKNQMLVSYKSLVTANDYVYELTEPGQQRGHQLTEICSYCGAAPVGIQTYIDSVHRQSLHRQPIEPKQIHKAYRDLLLTRELLAQIGQAVNSGRSIFLFGDSGNGKTSIAFRCIDAYDSEIWIPRTLTVGGEIIRLFDPGIHQEVEHRSSDALIKKSVVDERWVKIKRPKIIVGGELVFSQLEISENRFSGVLEAPIHMKSNNGCLVVDDFGRQQVSISELLNRWIIPLEKRKDYIRLPNGRKIEVPFEQMLVFSTNLEPGELDDTAFARRIPYKIRINSPTASQFAELFQKRAEKHNFHDIDGQADYLISSLQQNQQPLKFCFVDDILNQCIEFCEYHQQERKLSKAMLDFAMHNYFAEI